MNRTLIPIELRNGPFGGSRPVPFLVLPAFLSQTRSFPVPDPANADTHN
jgi:hypothetical protein